MLADSCARWLQVAKTCARWLRRWPAHEMGLWPSRWRTVATAREAYWPSKKPRARLSRRSTISIPGPLHFAASLETRSMLYARVKHFVRWCKLSVRLTGFLQVGPRTPDKRTQASPRMGARLMRVMFQRLIYPSSSELKSSSLPGWGSIFRRNCRFWDVVIPSIRKASAFKPLFWFRQHSWTGHRW